MTDGVDDELTRAREAYAHHEWRLAFDQLKTVDASRSLSAEDLERLAWAARWTGRYTEIQDALERAEAAYARADDRRGSARIALLLAHFHYERRNDAASRGCSGRAARLLADEPECAEHGLRASLRAAAALAQGDLAGARDYAEQTRTIGRQLHDRDLEALGLLWLGHVLLADGHVEDGLALHDEATAAATSGELGPLAAGTVYCSVIFACRNRADWRRASEWTEVASRWCDRESIGYFPGLCSVHRAEVFRHRGAFDAAEQSARGAGDQLLAANPRMAGWAFQELAEVLLRRGDAKGAAEACRRALEFGQDPQPVLARLRLAEGDTAGALRSIQRTLADPAVMSRENRVNLLPALVSSALAAGQIEAATEAADELESLARTFGSSVPLAHAAQARGEIDLAGGRAALAVERLRRARNLWTETDAPYEAACAQSLLAAALLSEGDGAAATLELEAASATFQRLGATLDAARVSAELAKLSAARATPLATDRPTKVLMFTDIVDSTKLVEALGDEAWNTLRHWHQRTLRSCFEANGGEEIDHAGDGFFVAFTTVEAATTCAIAIQRLLAEHRLQHGFAPQVRIGLHAAEVVQSDSGYAGKGVHEAARIASAGGGGDIVASRLTLAAVGDRFRCSQERELRLKGLSSPIVVMNVDWR